MSDGSAIRGHRAVAHTADVILEAWGPSFATCCEEAVAALAETCIDTSRADISERRVFHLPAATAETMLLDLLDEVIFDLDTSSFVPVGAEVRSADDGALDIELLMAARHTVETTGAAPKAISLSELRVEARRGSVRCAFLVDV